MNNFQKANELLKTKGYDLKNEHAMDVIDNLTDLIDEYFITAPDIDAWPTSKTRRGRDGLRIYLVCVIEDVYNQINGYGHVYNPTTDKELADLTKLISLTL